MHQLDLETLRSIVKAFIAVYPEGAALLATNSLDTPDFGLIARRDAGRFELQAVRERLDASRLPQRLAELGFADDFALLGSFIAGPRELARFAGDAPVNTTTGRSSPNGRRASPMRPTRRRATGSRRCCARSMSHRTNCSTPGRTPPRRNA